MKLKHLREERGLTRRELAEQSGVNYRSLQDYEQGHKNIFHAKGEVLYRLSMVLGCSVEDLLYDSLAEVKQKEQKNDRFFRLCIPEETVVNSRIYSSDYKVHGKWHIVDNLCELTFLYQGKIVILPFDAEFTEETLPWLVDAAEMKIESYIEEKIFQEKCRAFGGENWDEW